MMALLIYLFVLVTSAASRAVDIGSDDILPDKYIVTFKRGASFSDVDSHLASVNDIHARSLEHHPSLAGIERKYNISTFQGYAGAFCDETIAEIRASPFVASVEHDQLLYTADLETQTKVPSWGLGAISHRSGSGPTEYIFDNSARYETFAYILDTGINAAHEDFGGRASLEWSLDDGEGDFHGHGTHVAGTIGGHRYGVAKSTKIIAVKAVRPPGTVTAAEFLDAYNWATDDIMGHHGNHESRVQVSAINLSVQMPNPTAEHRAINDAIHAAFEAGILTVVAARNFAKDASQGVPASALGALTVGATTRDNEWAPYSSFGNVVNILAPGTGIISAWRDSSTASQFMSGTSMSTAHVTGLALYLMSLNKYEKPQDVQNHIMELGTRDRISGVQVDTPNLLAYNGNGA